ncbi:MAG: FAD-dependent oxidoreductase [Fibrobacteres bacterium]|nr:FAD-dependent oxidoreductase [Fibrobacterota bacterium]
MSPTPEQIGRAGAAGKPKIAVIGTGIAGMASAYLLHRVAEVTVFEKEGRPGGHANTVDVDEEGRKLPVDTGFIVYNKHTYPYFCKLLEELKVETMESDMSFSVKGTVSGFEYCGTNLATLFAQKRNLFRPWFYRMLWEIFRFNREGNRILAARSHAGHTLGRYLQGNGYSEKFREYYILPMGAAIWSTPTAKMMDFPLHSFLLFLANHGMLGVTTNFKWRTIKGGSREYVKKITAPFKDRIRYSSEVTGVYRDREGARVVLAGGETFAFDQVVMATHADITLRLLRDASAAEKDLLSLFAYQANDAVLHSGKSVLPKRQDAWAAWNYEVDESALNAAPCLHYHMNRLQGIPSKKEYIVTLNPATAEPMPDEHFRIRYEHPLYSSEGMDRQKEIDSLNGSNRTYFCGAYCGYGFHEDGLRSAVTVARHFGVEF